jgi:hypothetical protein
VGALLVRDDGIVTELLQVLELGCLRQIFST